MLDIIIAIHMVCISIVLNVFTAYNLKVGFMKSKYVFNENSGLANITLVLSEPWSSDINVTIYSSTKELSNGEYNYAWYCTMEYTHVLLST